MLCQQGGLGKKRINAPHAFGQKDLLVWMPLKDEFDKADPQLSRYTAEYRGVPVDRYGLRQKYVPRLHLLNDDRPLETTYRVDIGQQNPHRPPNYPVSFHEKSIIICQSNSLKKSYE